MEDLKSGTIKILGNGKNERYVINMFAQYYPGKPKYPNSTLDGTFVREQTFRKCLFEVSKIPNLESIAFSFGVGCNLGGGSWSEYLRMLNNFEKYVSKTYGTKVSIYQLKE